MKHPHPGTHTAPLSHQLLWLLLRGITGLNYSQHRWLSGILARVAPVVARRRVRIVRTNLKLCFPELKQPDLERLVQAVTESTILGILETLTAWVRPERLDRDKLLVHGLRSGIRGPVSLGLM